MTHTLARRLLAEYLGSAFLAAVVFGSGIAARQLSPDDTGLALLENAAATAAGLFTIILMFGPVSGGHFNPVVSLVDAHFGGLSWRDALAYIPAQIAGCVAGAITANGMFALTALSISDAPSCQRPSPVRRGHCDAGSAARHLLARPHGPRDERPGRRGRVHRSGLLVHELHELCEPRHQRGPDVLRHLLRHRPRLGAGLRRRAACRGPRRGSRSSGRCIPT